MNKNKIKETRFLTKERHKSLVCKVYEVKVDKSVLSNEKLEFLNRIFLEVKWWYNFVLSQQDVFKVDTKITKIPVLNKDKQFVEKELILCYYFKSKIQQRIMTSIKYLASNKKKGKRIGKLKFKSFINSIQGRFSIRNKNWIKIEGFKKYFRIIGIKQIPKNAEISEIRLIRKSFDFYFHITTFQIKQKTIITNNNIGIDFGIGASFNFSNGVKIDVEIKESKRIKILQRQFYKKQNCSKNRFKTRLKLQKAYERRDNQKKDICNKIISYLSNHFDHIIVQNDCIQGWQRIWGKKVNSSVIGRTLARLKCLSKTIVVDRFFPSTKLCPMCLEKTEHSLSDRVFVCKNCGYEEDRDKKSSKMISQEGLKQIGVLMEYEELTLVENKTSAAMLVYFKTIPNIEVSLCSLKQEGI